MNSRTDHPDRKQRLIRLIHVAKGQLGLDEEVYRGLLLAEGGAASTTKMGVAQLERVLARMKANGFKVRLPKGKETGDRRELAHDDPSRKIRALWLELHARGIVRSAAEASLAAFVKRMTGRAALQWLSSEQAAQVIENLKKWLERAEEEAASGVAE